MLNPLVIASKASRQLRLQAFVLDLQLAKPWQGHRWFSSSPWAGQPDDLLPGDWLIPKYPDANDYRHAHAPSPHWPNLTPVSETKQQQPDAPVRIPNEAIILAHLEGHSSARSSGEMLRLSDSVVPKGCICSLVCASRLNATTTQRLTQTGGSGKQRTSWPNNEPNR